MSERGRADQPHVYVIATKRDGKLCAPIKIGKSKAPRVRVAALRTACPYEVALVFAFPVGDKADVIERAAHKELHRLRLHGEWFDFPPADAVSLVAIISEVACCGNRLGDPAHRAHVQKVLGIAASEAVCISVDPDRYSCLLEFAP